MRKLLEVWVKSAASGSFGCVARRDASYCAQDDSVFWWCGRAAARPRVPGRYPTLPGDKAASRGWVPGVVRW